MKRTICVVLAIVLSMSCISAFAEVKCSTWAQEDVERARIYKWINDGDFTKNITRREFCTVAKKVLDFVGLEVDFDHFDEKTFNDTDSYEILYLYSLGIIKGKSDDEFKPDDLITREEAAVILTRMCSVLELDKATVNDFSYADHAEISSWAKESVYKISNIGLMKGTDTGFAPKEKFTIEQSVATFVRLYDLMNKSDENKEKSFADIMNEAMPKDKNYMFSPLSVKMLFALAANGANAETEAEILNAFGIEDLEEYNLFCKELIEKYTKSEEIKINLKNSIWINKSVTDSFLNGDFEVIAEDYYFSEVNTVPKSSAKGYIDDWVTKVTEEKITNVHGIPNNFYTMLINAVYFNGVWQNEFDEKLTAPDVFTDGVFEETEIDFMNCIGWYNYYKDKNLRVAELPFRCKGFEVNGQMTRLDISMFLIDSANQADIEAVLNMIDGKMKNTYIELSMPKFEFEYSMKLQDSLSLIGLDRVFDFNFNKILEDETLYVDDVQHQSYINVNEKGVEAAAVTAMSMGGGSQRPPEPVEAKFNKPFYFAVRDNSSGEILFMGRYAYVE